MAQASNGKVYAVTLEGGYDDSCVICEYDPNTGVNNKVFDFFVDPTLGWEAEGGLILGSDGKLYGMTEAGGQNDYGVIYSFDPQTYAYTVLHEFNDTSGSMAAGNLLENGNGIFYGVTEYGGAHSAGEIGRASCRER